MPPNCRLIQWKWFVTPSLGDRGGLCVDVCRRDILNHMWKTIINIHVSSINHRGLQRGCHIAHHWLVYPQAKHGSFLLLCFALGLVFFLTLGFVWFRHLKLPGRLRKTLWSGFKMCPTAKGHRGRSWRMPAATLFDAPGMRAARGIIGAWPMPACLHDSNHRFLLEWRSLNPTLMFFRSLWSEWFKNSHTCRCSFWSFSFTWLLNQEHQVETSVLLQCCAWCHFSLSLSKDILMEHGCWTDKIWGSL